MSRNLIHSRPYVRIERFAERLRREALRLGFVDGGIHQAASASCYIHLGYCDCDECDREAGEVCEWIKVRISDHDRLPSCDTDLVLDAESEFIYAGLERLAQKIGAPPTRAMKAWRTRKGGAPMAD